PADARPARGRAEEAGPPGGAQAVPVLEALIRGINASRDRRGAWRRADDSKGWPLRIDASGDRRGALRRTDDSGRGSGVPTRRGSGAARRATPTTVAEPTIRPAAIHTPPDQPPGSRTAGWRAQEGGGGEKPEAKGKPSNGRTPAQRAPRGGCPFRAPDQPLEPEDAAVHLRPA